MAEGHYQLYEEIAGYSDWSDNDELNNEFRSQPILDNIPQHPNSYNNLENRIKDLRSSYNSCKVQLSCYQRITTVFANFDSDNSNDSVIQGDSKNEDYMMMCKHVIDKTLIAVKTPGQNLVHNRLDQIFSTFITHANLNESYLKAAEHNLKFLLLNKLNSNYNHLTFSTYLPSEHAKIGNCLNRISHSFQILVYLKTILHYHHISYNITKHAFAPRCLFYEHETYEIYLKDKGPYSFLIRKKRQLRLTFDLREEFKKNTDEYYDYEVERRITELFILLEVYIFIIVEVWHICTTLNEESVSDIRRHIEFFGQLLKQFLPYRRACLTLPSRINGIDKSKHNEFARNLGSFIYKHIYKFNIKLNELCFIIEGIFA